MSAPKKFYTDYPIVELGDKEFEDAPIRECKLLSFDGSLYLQVEVDGVKVEIKNTYIYHKEARLGEVECITNTMINKALAKKNKGGRPTKMTKKLIDAMVLVVEDALFLTDEDFVFLINEQLAEKDKISIRTFKSYKQKSKQSVENNDVMEMFLPLIKKALITQKLELLKDVKVGDNGWQSKAWILERKFKEWNLKNISETDITTKGESINLTEEQTIKISKAIDETI